MTTVRINKAQLERAIKALNATFGLPDEPYQKERDERGNLVANAGMFVLDKAYGGWRVERMSPGGGQNGVSQRGTAREAYDAIQMLMKGAEIMENTLMPRYLVSAMVRKHSALGKFENKAFSFRVLAGLSADDRDWALIKAINADGYELNHICTVTAV